MRHLFQRAAKVTARKVRVRRHHAPSAGRFLRPVRKSHVTLAAVANQDEVFPSREQLKAHFVQTAVPMVGFGFMDQTILLQAGNAIDCTFGVWLGLSTLSAAAVGSIISNMGSVVFGGVVERTAAALGLPSAHFTSTQKRLAVVGRTGMYGSLAGIFIGCVLGLVNLLFIDTDKARELKYESTSPIEGLYEIDATNSERDDATVIRIKGPDRDGLLAAITDAFGEASVRVLEVDAHPSQNMVSAVEDVFVVQSKEKKKIREDRLTQLVDAISGHLVGA